MSSTGSGAVQTAVRDLLQTRGPLQHAHGWLAHGSWRWSARRARVWGRRSWRASRRRPPSWPPTRLVGGGWWLGVWGTDLCFISCRCLRWRHRHACCAPAAARRLPHPPASILVKISRPAAWGSEQMRAASASTSAPVGASRPLAPCSLSTNGCRGGVGGWKSEGQEHRGHGSVGAGLHGGWSVGIARPQSLPRACLGGVDAIHRLALREVTGSRLLEGNGHQHQHQLSADMVPCTSPNRPACLGVGIEDHRHLVLSAAAIGLQERAPAKAGQSARSCDGGRRRRWR